MGHRSLLLSGAALLTFLVLATGCRQGPFPIPTPTPSLTKTFPVIAEEPFPSGPGGAGAGVNTAAVQATYNRECNACHPGGGAGVGPGLRTLASKMNADTFAKIVRDGAGMMPGFKADRVSDSDIKGMWAFLTGAPAAAVEKPAPVVQAKPQTPAPAPGTLAPKPQGTVAAKADQPPADGAGQRAFEQLCNACHPAGGQGLGPSLKGLADKSTRQAFNSVTREGKGIMPGFKADRLSDGDLEAIWNYLRDLK